MRVLRLLTLLIFAVVLSAQTPPPTQLNANLTGAWAGQLEYRDFRTNERTFLPTWLTMTPTADGTAVRLAYIYDDGPTKTVREALTLTFSADGRQATVRSEGDGTSESYAVSGMDAFRKLNRGVLVLTGPGKENGAAIDTRLTLTLRRNLFTWLKETRPAGQGEFTFRDQYTLTRATPPSI